MGLEERVKKLENDSWPSTIAIIALAIGLVFNSYMSSRHAYDGHIHISPEDTKGAPECTLPKNK
jgi:hypothetical protein